MKVAYIIAGYLGKRASHIHDPAIPRTEWRSVERHDQDYSTPEKVRDMIMTHVRNVQTMDFGVPVDIYLMLGSKEEIGETEFDALDEQPAVDGIIKVVKRGNMGHSYGAYTEAYEGLAAGYDAFYFSEDDFFMKDPGFIKAAVGILKDNPRIGFLTPYCLNQVHPQIHANGGIGMARTVVLDRSNKEFGKIIPFECYVDDRKMAIHAEVNFTHRFIMLGYDLATYTMHDGTYAVDTYYKFLETRKEYEVFDRGISFKRDEDNNLKIEFGGNEVGQVLFKDDGTEIFFAPIYLRLGLQIPVIDLLSEHKLIQQPA